MSKKIKVAVVFGGKSSEYKVSLLSAKSVLENINREKYDVSMIGITPKGKWINYNGPISLIATGKWQSYALLNSSSSEEQNNIARIISPTGIEDERDCIDVIYPVLHGLNGEDGTVQGLFELAGVPYVGCGIMGSALGMDKGFAKTIFDKEGIPQGKYRVILRNEIESEMISSSDMILGEIEQQFGYPCFIKPCNCGSSVGVSKAHDRGELLSALKLAGEYDRRIIVEEFIDGKELECGILGNDEPKASVVGEVAACNEFYDYDAKYSGESTSQTIIPANINYETEMKVRDYAVKAFKALDCSGIARVDFFLEKGSERILINEINTMPGFTKISMYPKLWEATGVPYGKLIDELIMLALDRHDKNKKCTTVY